MWGYQHLKYWDSECILDPWDEPCTLILALVILDHTHEADICGLQLNVFAMIEWIATKSNYNALI